MASRTLSTSRGVTSLGSVMGGRLRTALLASTALALAMTLPAAGPARAQDATWQSNPGSGDFFDLNNWTPNSVPSGTATFGASNTTTLTLGTAGSFGGWTFDAGASNYTFNVTSAQNFTGSGITINGGSATIINYSTLDFLNISTAGSAAIINNSTLHFSGASTAGSANITNNSGLLFLTVSSAGDAVITNSGTIQTTDSASLGNATITNNANLYLQDISTAGSATITNNHSMYFYASSTAGTATIINNSSLNFWQNSSADNAHITNAATGTFEIVNNSTLANATVINSGRMIFREGNPGDVPTAGNATITNNAGGTIEFRDGSTGAYATITNAGTVTFIDRSTAGNARLFNNGTGAVFDFSGSVGPNSDNKLSAGSIAGNGTFALGANELTVGANDLSTEVSGGITGTGGSLVKTGDGTLTLSGTNTYTGGTTIDGGTLVISGSIASGTVTNMGALTYAGSASAGSATITNSNSLNFDNASAAGSAHITNNYGGMLTFNSTSSAGSASITNNSAMYFYDNSMAGSATITNNYSLGFYGTSTASSAATTNTGGALLGFNNASSAGNATITNNAAGTLTFDDASTAGSANITNSGDLYFYGTSTAGNAAVINNAGGTVDFSGSTGPNGDGRLSAGSIAGAGGYILGTNELTVGGNNLSTEVSGVISGAGGSLVKVGTGTLTLSGANTYTGATTVLGGLLNIVGTLAGTMDVSSGGKIGGGGTLGTVNVGSGGILSPGNSIGTVTIGTLTTNAGAFYDVELTDGGNTPGVHNDLINVTGVATINAGLTIRVMPENGTDTGATYLPGTVYTIVATTAPGDLTVNAAPAVTDSFAFLNFTASSDTQKLYLTSALAATSFCVAGSTANQCGVGDAAFALGSGNAVFDAMVGLGDGEVAAALNSISGEAHASIQSVIEGTFTQLGEAMIQRASRGLSGGEGGLEPMGYAAPISNSGVVAIDDATGAARSAWLAPIAGNGHIAADGNAAALDWWSGGLGGGYELAADGTVRGIALSYQRVSASIPTLQSQASVDSLAISAYGATQAGATSLAAALTLGTSHVATSRTIAVGGTTEEAMASYWMPAIGMRLEAGHDLELGNGTALTPLASLAAGWTGHGGFTETGAGAFNLVGAPSGSLYLETGLGLGVSHMVLTEDGSVTLSGRAVWEHDLLGGKPGQVLSFADGTAPFVVSGRAAGGDRLQVGAGLAFTSDDGVRFEVDYGGSFGAGGQTHHASLAFNTQF